MAEPARACACAHCGAVGGVDNSMSYKHSGDRYSGPDGDLTFCDFHFKELYPLYLSYKVAEKENGFRLLEDRLTSLDHWSQDQVHFWIRNIDNIIRQREALQARLERPIGSGHAKWMTGLVKAQIKLHNAKDEVGWLKVQGKKEKRQAKKKKRQDNEDAIKWGF